jgi:transposase InsO family protein
MLDNAALKDLVGKNLFGYRRLREMARRKGNVMNLKKVYRLYREEGLMVRRRRGRKRALGTRAPLQSARRPNEVWVLDFVADGSKNRATSMTSRQMKDSGVPASIDLFSPQCRKIPLIYLWECYGVTLEGT